MAPVNGEVVIDASVIVKWIFPSPEEEPDASRALELLAALGEGAITAIEPPHWLAEVSAVVSRRSPARATEVIRLLYSMGLSVVDDLEIYERAARLASETRQHVFDTLYHAVALTRPDASLVTADEHYYRAAKRAGRLIRLADLA
jgi:predicted nucleic acid-binding protein